MRFLDRLRLAYKLTNLQYPHKNSLSYTFDICKGVSSTQERSFGSKTSEGKVNGDEQFQEAFAILSLLRDNGRQVEIFTENFEKVKTGGKKDEDEDSSMEEKMIITKEMKGPGKNVSLEINLQNTANSLPVNSTMMEINEIPSFDLNFDKEMTNLKKALLNPSNLLSSSSNLNDSTLSLSTYTRLEPYDSTTIPLHLNTLINGTVAIDDKKTAQYHLQSLKVPEFSENLTSLAANLCSAAVQSGFSSGSCRKYYCTDNSLDANSIQKLVDQKVDIAKKVHPASDEIVKDLLKKYDDFRDGINALAATSTVAGKEIQGKNRDPRIVCVRDGNKGCISPGDAPYSTKKANENGLGLLDPQLYKRSLKDAENKRKQLAKASASCKEKLNIKACQSKKSKTESKIKDPYKSTASKCSDLLPTSKCGQEMGSVKNFESLTEPSSSLKYGFQKVESVSKSTPGLDSPRGSVEDKAQLQSSNSGSAVITSKLDSLNAQGSSQKEPPQPSLTKSKCTSSENAKPKDPCKSLPKMSAEQNEESSSEKKTQLKICSENVTEAPKCSRKSEPKSNTSLNCSTKSELKLENPCKVSPITKTKSCGSSSEKEDPCKVPSITFEKAPEKSKCETSKGEKPSPCALMTEKSASASKCSEPSKPKCEARKGEKPLPCASMSEKSASASKCSEPSKPKCEPSNGEKPLPCASVSEKSVSASKCSEPSKPKCGASKGEKPLPCASMSEKSPAASKCSEPSKPKCASMPDKSLSTPKCSSTAEKEKDDCITQSDVKTSKFNSKCSSSSCIRSQKEPLDANSEKACKRVGMTAKESCESEPKNPCKSSCDSMMKPKVKCGRPPRGDTRPRCKKDSKCGSKKPSPCAPKEQPESKCGTEKKSPEEPSKCASKACAPSPKTSKTEIKPKSTLDSGLTKSKTAPSSEPIKRNFHRLTNFSMPNLIFSRKFSDDCPKKPKGGYKLESERSDEYRRETCENFSWKATKSTKKRTNTPKNCYPEETQEFCPDTACYKVYAETSGKADKKTSKKNPKANNMEKNEALCTKKSFDYQKRHFSSKAIENEEALIQRPHSICTKRLILPEVSDNDALICIDSVALSDTDIYMFETGGRHTQELTLGNEAAGVVTEVGRSICNLKAGDHVALESGIPCFKCDLCKAGRYNLCNNISFKGFLKNQSIHPASFCHKICPPVPLEQVALIPQLALGCNACYQAGIKPNSKVAIIGSCAKTVCAAICAISMGAENVCVICGMPETQILIEHFVTEKVSCFDSNTIEIGIVRTILATLGTYPDIIINFSACTKTMNAAIMALKPAGVCAVAGFVSECVSFNIIDALMKEIQIIPSFRSKNMFPKAIHLLESGRAPLDCLIANCELCKWNELESAFKLALSEGNNGPRKAIVKCQLNS